MWVRNKDTGMEFYITSEHHIKDIFKQGNIEEIQKEEKKPEKKGAKK